MAPFSPALAGTALSIARINDTEQTFFEYELPANAKWGYTTHFWITTEQDACDAATIRFYVDGEAPIEFNPPMASGVAWGDQTVFMHKWAGNGAERSAWNINYRIPFAKSLRITYQLPAGVHTDTVFMIVRGITDTPLTIGGVEIPLPAAKMQLQKKNETLQPMDFLSIVDTPSTMDGLVFMTTLAFQAANEHSLEGCFHFYVGPRAN